MMIRVNQMMKFMKKMIINLIPLEQQVEFQLDLYC